MGFPWTKIALGAFAGYLAYTVYIMYGIFKPPSCTKGNQCLKSFLESNPKLGLYVATSLYASPHNSLTAVWKYDNLSLTEVVEKEFKISIPAKTRKNGTLYVHTFVYPRGGDPLKSYYTHDASKITTYALPQASVISLLSDTSAQNQTVSGKGKPKSGSDVPHAHWRQRLTVSVMDEDIALDRHKLPGEIYHLLRMSKDGKYYLPIVFIDELGYRIKDLLPINESSSEMPLTITYAPISLGKMRMWISIKQSFKMLLDLGFTEKDTDEIKGIFADTNFYFLMLTFTVAAFHLLFDFLAFKNDILYWKSKKTMIGLSVRVVVWRCLSTGIIFLYLLDENTSLLVLVPCGVGMIIEIWKVTKALKVTVHWSGIIPKFKFGDSSEKEKETEQFDSQAMKYLSYVLYPLCLGGAVYSLLYVQHKSWYSWCINSLVNGVYAFGFLFMLPQLFVNYKLKSVAHLPWRAFMYKAFNTFIDDVFAFIITMPAAHRLACFRDDIVFVIYLYQRWLYPVDKKRANEFGVSYEDEDTKAESKKTK
ncbi:cleft lip and palate transmembrane protein 1-like protein [Aplysia californica]|uniref:Lipid scramblase CLPTM1L n=1 Tax=Aplysia californica TaxID=6500 RepID=A0ABM1ABF8_APLCA|nr:cleft lip and palate transmembrane protein 1-like protein [Aplysia californica]